MTARPWANIGCGAVPQVKSLSEANAPRFQGPPTKNGTRPEVKSEESWVDGMPRGDEPSAKSVRYQVRASIQPWVVTAGVSMSPPVMPDPPWSDSTSGCNP